jgi:hypothetical protein
MKLLNELGAKLRLTTKPKFSDLLTESVQSSPEARQASTEAAQKSVSTPVFSKMVESAGQDQRAKFLDAITSVTGPVHASELRQFPTADCLSPEEVYEKEKLGANRLAHLQQCSWCETMVSGSHASPEEAAAWVRDLESRLHTRERVAGRGQHAV